MTIFGRILIYFRRILKNNFIHCVSILSHLEPSYLIWNTFWILFSPFCDQNNPNLELPLWIHLDTFLTHSNQLLTHFWSRRDNFDHFFNWINLEKSSKNITAIRIAFNLWKETEFQLESNPCGPKWSNFGVSSLAIF